MNKRKMTLVIAGLLAFFFAFVLSLKSSPASEDFSGYKPRQTATMPAAVKL
jgi:hypothetical protein